MFLLVAMVSVLYYVLANLTHSLSNCVFRLALRIFLLLTLLAHCHQSLRAFLSCVVNFAMRLAVPPWRSLFCIDSSLDNCLLQRFFFFASAEGATKLKIIKPMVIISNERFIGHSLTYV